MHALNCAWQLLWHMAIVPGSVPVQEPRQDPLLPLQSETRLRVSRQAMHSDGRAPTFDVLVVVVVGDLPVVGGAVAHAVSAHTANRASTGCI